MVQQLRDIILILFPNFLILLLCTFTTYTMISVYYSLHYFLKYHSDLCLICLQTNCDINTKDNSGNTPLDTAISEGNTYLIEQLIGYGADLNTTDESGCTPLNVLTFLDIAEVTIKFRPISSSTPELLKVVRH